MSSEHGTEGHGRSFKDKDPLQISLFKTEGDGRS